MRWKWLSETRNRGGGEALVVFFLKKSSCFRLSARQPDTHTPGPNFPSLRPGVGRPTAQNYGLRPPPWAFGDADWPGLWLWKLCPGAWVSGGFWRAVEVEVWWLLDEKVVNVLSFVLNLYVCMYVVEILFLYFGRWIFAVVIFIKFLKLHLV